MTLDEAIKIVKTAVFHAVRQHHVWDPQEVEQAADIIWHRLDAQAAELETAKQWRVKTLALAKLYKLEDLLDHMNDPSETSQALRLFDLLAVLRRENVHLSQQLAEREQELQSVRDLLTKWEDAHAAECDRYGMSAHEKVQQLEAFLAQRQP